MNRTDLETLIHSHLDGRITADEMEQLSQELEADSRSRRVYLRLAHLHAALGSLEQDGRASLHAIGPPTTDQPSIQPSRVARPSRITRLAVPLAALLVTGLMLLLLPPWKPEPLKKEAAAPVAIARLASLKNCRWVNAETLFQEGDRLTAGQRLELASGEARIEFDHGAVVVLSAPAIFDIVSSHDTFLMLGHVQAEATTEASHGFCVRTRTARFVDFGTAFSAVAAADGHSQVEVTSGMVEVQLASTASRHMLRAGESMGIEPGQSAATTRIESGDGTAAFRFPTIAPPSASDHADRSQGLAVLSCRRGAIDERSGPLDVLRDGRGQSQADAPEESLYFRTNEAGLLLLDLGSVLPITRINTYSWHQDHGSDANRIRATQKFYLYGSAEADAPGTDGPLAEQGWVLLGRVNTDEFFDVSQPRTRPEQQATSIAAPRGSIGTYRHLLWDVRPSRSGTQPVEDSTFYGEIDVYVD